MVMSKNELVGAVAKRIQDKDLSQQAVGVLRRSTEKVLERIQQNVDAQVKEDSYPVIEKFCDDITQKLSAMSQHWVDSSVSDLVMFPEGTRYIFRDGEYCTVVIEQQPQNRHINICGDVYLLAMPYMQFIISFHNERFKNLYVGMTRKPAQSLDGMIFNPILPNINEHHVCTGNMAVQKDGSMAEKVENIISGFWQSQFTEDGDGFMHLFLEDNKIRNISDWQKKSQADPTFVLHKDIKYRPGKTIRRFLAGDEGKNGQISLANNLKTEIVKAVGVIGCSLKEMLTNIDMKTENRDKSHIDVLQEVFKEIIVQAYSELWEFLQQQLQNDRKKLQDEMEVATNKLKRDFNYYMDNYKNLK